MHDLFAQLVEGIRLTGELSEDVPTLLRHHGCPNTVVHSAEVAAEAKRLALRFGVGPAQAEQAGWLHDVSAVFASDRRVQVAGELGIPLLAEEKAFPLIIHQKLSVVVARELFGVADRAVLSAIGCHTTLKAGASPLDKVVFVADKVAWDQPGEPPYLSDLLAALDSSLDAAAFVYLTHLWQRRASLRVIHPWLREAYEELVATNDIVRGSSRGGN